MNHSNLVAEFIQTTREVFVVIPGARVFEIQAFQGEPEFQAEDGVCDCHIDALGGSGSKWSQRLCTFFQT
jgi:hypothetical protein